MASYSKGADVQALVANVGRLKSLRGELKGIEGASRSAMSTIEGNWGGENLLSLVRHFNATAVPSLRSLDTAIDSMTTALQRNANAQDIASGGDGNLFGSGFGGAKASGSGGGGGSVGGEPEPKRTPYFEAGKGEKQDVTFGKKKEYELLGSGRNERTTYGNGWNTHREENNYDRDPRKGYDSKTETKYDQNTYDRDGDRRRHEWGHETTSEKDVDRTWLPSSEDNADKNKERAERDEKHPNRAALRDAALTSVNATHREDLFKVGQDFEKDPTGVMTAGASGHSEFGIKDGALYAGAGVAGSAYLARAGTGEHKLDLPGGGQLKGSASAGIGAQGNADAGVSFGKDGLVAGANAHVQAGAMAEASGSYTHGPVEASAKVEAMAGAEANANASIGIGKDGVTAKAGVDAFAGAKAGGEVSGSVAGIGGTVGGEVYAGIGAHANVDASFSAEKVKVSVDVGAALGVGAGVKFSIDVNPSKFLDDVGLSQVNDVVGDAVGGFIKKLF